MNEKKPTAMKPAPSLACCVLRGSESRCVTDSDDGGLLHCSKCGRMGSPLLIDDSSRARLMSEPLEVRELIAELVSVDNYSDVVLYVGVVDSRPRWELDGIGRTTEYPSQIHLQPKFNDYPRCVIRHGIIEKGWTDNECKLEAPSLEVTPFAGIRQDPIFISVTSRLERSGLSYLGIVGPVFMRSFVFSKTFTPSDESTEHGVIAVLSLPPVSRSELSGI